MSNTNRYRRLARHARRVLEGLRYTNRSRRALARIARLDG